MSKDVSVKLKLGGELIIGLTSTVEQEPYFREAGHLLREAYAIYSQGAVARRDELSFRRLDNMCGLHVISRLLEDNMALKEKMEAYEEERAGLERVEELLDEAL